MSDLPEDPADPYGGPRRCANCDGPLYGDDALGRPRRWCSDYCRNAGYVAERALADMTIGTYEVLCSECHMVHSRQFRCSE